MLKAGYLVLLGCGAILPGVGVADDENSSSDDRVAPSVPSSAVAPFLSKSGNALALQSSDLLVSPVYADSGPISDFEFRDNSLLGRVSELRGFSLLTLAERGRSRLFIGVNETGLAGLHFGAFRYHSGENYIELVRMPYLETIETETDDAPPGLLSE